MCLSIAFLLWLGNALNKNYTHTLRIPVKFLNLPVNKVIIGEIPEKLEITIKTSGLKLIFIGLQKLTTELIIDFNSLKTNAKSQTYSISNANFELNSLLNFNVDILKIRPDTLFFTSDKTKSKTIPIKLITNFSFEKGYALVNKPILTPSYISISGDSINLKQIDTIYTQPLILTNINQSINTIAILSKPSANVNYNTKEIKVNLNVDRFTENTITIPISILNKPNEKIVKLIPNQTSITYLIGMNSFKQVNENSFKAIVDYDQIKNNNKQLTIELIRVPSEVKLIKTEPITISYLKYN